jgi:hypothetical protein
LKEHVVTVAQPKKQPAGDRIEQRTDDQHFRMLRFEAQNALFAYRLIMHDPVASNTVCPKRNQTVRLILRERLKTAVRDYGQKKRTKFTH